MGQWREKFCENPSCGLNGLEYIGRDRIEIADKPSAIVPRPGTVPAATGRYFHYESKPWRRGSEEIWLCQICSDAIAFAQGNL